MVANTAAKTGNGQYISANGVDIYYVEAGQGEPVLLLHGGLLSSRLPIGYGAYMDMFAEQFHIIAPDTRGHGRTVNPTRGPISYDQLADDVVALIDALGLDRPLICGFSDGGHIATIVGIKSPDSVRAIVNDAGYDVFNPNAPSMTLARRMFGGSPDATRGDPDAMERSFSSSDQMRGMFQMMRAEHDAAQGEGYWKTLIAEAFDRFTTSPGYTFEDLSAIRVPTLILTGDRDFACSPEDAVTAYRKLNTGELAILPGVEHAMPPQKVDVTIDFLRRHAGIGSVSA